MLGKLLAGSGYEVRKAYCAAGAIDLAQREHFDVLISDIGLPDATGYQLMRQLRETYAAIRGIAMSGFGMDEDIRKSHEAGFGDHLVEPISFAPLEDSIRRLVHVAG